MNFQDLCEVKDEDNIVLKDSVDKAEVNSNDDIVNNILGLVFRNKHTAQERKPHLKEYKLASVELGVSAYYAILDHFDIINKCNMFRMFDILVSLNTNIESDSIKYHYTWIVYEMGGK